MSVADSASLDLTTGMTLMAWVRPSSVAYWRTVMLKEQPGQLVYALYSSSDGDRPSGHVFAGGDRQLDGTSVLPVNAWTHLATTYDGANQRLFVNGVQVSSRAQTGAIATSNNPLKIGGNAIWGEWYAGLIDEVRIYNRALPAAEVTSAMNAPVG